MLNIVLDFIVESNQRRLKYNFNYKRKNEQTVKLNLTYYLHCIYYSKLLSTNPSYCIKIVEVYQGEKSTLSQHYLKTDDQILLNKNIDAN